MRIVRARLRPLSLRLRRPLRTAHERVDERRGDWIALEDADGLRGQGAAFPIAGFGLEERELCGRALARAAEALCAAGELELDAALDRVEQETGPASCATSALDAALHDLAARRAGMGVARLVAGRAARTSVPQSVLLAGEDEASLEAAVERALAVGVRALKLKVGARPPPDDLARVARVRAQAGRGVALRLDANGAFAPGEARRRLEAFARHDIDYVEQPVAGLAELACLRRDSPIALAADEAATGRAAAFEALERGAADVLIVKPSACGGLRAAAAIAAKARASGVACVAGSLLDSGLSIALALHAAASWPLAPPPCGLATADLLVDDVVTLAGVEAGELPVPPGPGLGVAAEADALERLASAPERVWSA